MTITQVIRSLDDPLKLTHIGGHPVKHIIRAPRK
jgi:hypothetical protein